MSYANVKQRLQTGETLILDGGTGTELERRGIVMDPDVWCGTASLGNVRALIDIHKDYIAAGADIITANTYASSRLMLEPAGFGDRFTEINKNAISAAQQARKESGRHDVLVAGSLSHMTPLGSGSAVADPQRAPSQTKMKECFRELALLIKDEGCDFILLEMMYFPERIPIAIEAALASGLPVWLGLSARRGDNGQLISFAQDREIPFADIVHILKDYELDVAGVMHTPSNLIDEAISILREEFTGSLMAYPDSGYFTMPKWQFKNIIPPAEFLDFANSWVDSGVQIVGG
ncbi:MAG: S-methylmethionine-dependent homocysteine/selenocysteine methylase, partial [Gammaproteobacteria bacterium]